MVDAHEQYLERIQEEELARIKDAWDGGNYEASIAAIQPCISLDRPLPDWLAAAVEHALQFTYRNGGAEGQGKLGGYFARTQRQAIHKMRWALVSRALELKHQLPDWGYRATRQGAFKWASDQLKGTPARGSPGAIKKSFEKVQRDQSNPTNSLN